MASLAHPHVAGLILSSADKDRRVWRHANRELRGPARSALEVCGDDALLDLFDKHIPGDRRGRSEVPGPSISDNEPTTAPAVPKKYGQDVSAILAKV